MNYINMSVMKLMLPEKHKHFVDDIGMLIEADHPSSQLIKRFVKTTNTKCAKKFIKNLVLKGMIINQRKRDKALERGEVVPVTILISPTMRCNFRCEGCYAGNYKQEEDLPFEVVDRIVKEGNKLGVGFYTILGGEPFIWKYLFKLCDSNRNTYFQVYTNGSLIDEEIVDGILDLGNVMPMFSLEGFDKQTDKRRGKGAYKKVMKAMKMLKDRGVPFGYSVCVTRNNVEEVMSDKFIDMMINKGAYIGWHFMAMPIGSKPNLKLIPTPKQRVYMLERDKYIRANKSLFIVDFWNDAPYVGGCIAAKCYIHINSEGWVEPCIFTHFAEDNIKNTTLKEALNSKFFKAIRKRQPYNENLFLPCMLIDNPKVFREISKEVDIVTTHKGAESILMELKPSIDKYSKEVKKLYKPIWKEYKNGKV